MTSKRRFRFILCNPIFHPLKGLYFHCIASKSFSPTLLTYLRPIYQFK